MKFHIYIFSLILLFSVCHFAQEEDRIELSSISFIGNETFSDGDLRAVIQSEESPMWLWMFLNSFTFLGSPPTYFDSTSISIDLISLKSFYSVNGFFKAEINYSFEIDTLEKSADLIYDIKENSPFGYHTVQFPGLEKLNDWIKSNITEYMEYFDSERYSQEKVQKKNENIITYLKNNGYMFATYDSSIVKIDTITSKIDLLNYFTTESFYRYSDIQIEKTGDASSEVSYELIKYITNINVGDTYRENEISKSRLRLARTGLFSSINLKGVSQDSVAGKAQLQITGTVTPLNELSPQIFADNELGYFNLGVGASYVRKNFLGDARKFTIRASFRINDIANIDLNSNEFFDALQSEVELSAILEQPFLFSRNVAGRLEIYLKSYNIESVDYQNYGANFNSAVDMPNYTFINLLSPYLRFDRLYYNIPYFEYEGNPTTVSPRTFTTSLGAEIGSTNTDDLFFPREGRNISLITEFSSANVKWDAKNLTTNEVILNVDSVGLYLKFQLTWGSYYTVSRDKNSIFALKLKSGYIQMLSGTPALVSPNQTFFAGGSNSVRGWKSRELIPPDNYYDDLFPPSLNEELKIRGGTFLLEGSFEFRRRFEEDFGYVLFLDYGNTWNGADQFQWNEVAVAIGTGIRYYSAIAPFRLDFGFKLYDPKDLKYIYDVPFLETMVINFGIGEAF
jgi:outer membrane protein insertion porin family